MSMTLGGLRTALAISDVLEGLPDDTRVMVEWVDPTSGAIQLLTPLGHARSTEEGDAIILSTLSAPPEED